MHCVHLYVRCFNVICLGQVAYIIPCALTPDAARVSKWPEVIDFQWEPAASSGESGAARFGRWERRGELKSGQLYGNELWRGSAATNQNVEVLRLRGLQRTQPVNFGSHHISSRAQ